MLRMLQHGFCHHAVPGPLRVTCQLDVFFIHLRSISTNTNARSVRIKILTGRVTTPGIVAMPSAILFWIIHALPLEVRLNQTRDKLNRIVAAPGQNWVDKVFSLGKSVSECP